MAQLKKQVLDLLVQKTGIDSYYFTEFEFRVDETPMSSIKYPLITVFLYCVGIPLLQKFMKDREAPPLKYVLVVHNLFLSISSAFVAFLMILALLEFKEGGYGNFQIYCALTHYDQQGLLTTLFYVNYLLKYYELLDTIFLSLKHKPIGFLHAYHHPATLVLTWGQLVDSTGVQWVVILLNLFVHTVMYFYYFLAAVKIKVPYKNIVTILQIVQFVIDLCACYYAWANHHWWGNCFGTPRAGLVGCFILTSYLYLFVDFYQETYHKKPSKSKQRQRQKKDQ